MWMKQLFEPLSVCLLLISQIQLCMVHTLTKICMHSWSRLLKYIIVHVRSNLSDTAFLAFAISVSQTNQISTSIWYIDIFLNNSAASRNLNIFIKYVFARCMQPKQVILLVFSQFVIRWSLLPKFLEFY